MTDLCWPLAEARATEAVGAALAEVLSGLPRQARATLLTFSGELGAGKTTLVRGLLRALGVRGAVKSPSYTLVEPYEVAGRFFYHLDLYRIGDPDELEFLGLRDMLSGADVLLVEWPERAAGALPRPDLALYLEYAVRGRDLRFRANSVRGTHILGLLEARAPNILGT